MWISLCYWSGENIQVLLSKAQSERHRFLLWRHCRSSVRMAHHWYDSWDLWVRLTVQVKKSTLPHINYYLYWIGSFQRVLPCSYKFPQKSSRCRHIFEYAGNQIGKCSLIKSESNKYVERKNSWEVHQEYLYKNLFLIVCSWYFPVDPNCRGRGYIIFYSPFGNCPFSYLWCIFFGDGWY